MRIAYNLNHPVLVIDDSMIDGQTALNTVRKFKIIDKNGEFYIKFGKNPEIQVTENYLRQYILLQKKPRH